jgi:hypothetical protein
MKTNICIFIFILLLVNQVVIGQNFSGGYNFPLPFNDSTTQFFLPDFPKKSIEEAERVSTNGDKFFSKGKQIRFWGVNISASACFPSKTNAEAVAGRLRKMGVNLVRIHHYDNPWSDNNGSIFNYTNGTRQLNLTTLDRLDYFIAQLKANGIYVNINLNNSRTFQAQDGVPAADSLQEFAKGISIFDPILQQLQREHAAQYLSHVNPYTGKSLATDPVVAMVELNNENTLYGMWKSNQLTTFAKGGILPVFYNKRLDSLFCIFLKSKYVTQTALATAWNGSGNTASPQFLQNTNFDFGNTNSWILEKYTTAAATVAATAAHKTSGTHSALLDVTQVTGTDWHIQFKQSNLVLQKDSTYQLVFKARTDGSSKTANLSMSLDVSPYTWYTGTDFTLTSAWQTFKFTLTAPENIANMRISISPKQNIGKFYFDDFSFSKPQTDAFIAGEDLNTCSVQRIPYGERSNFTTQRIADLGAFYIQIQKEHFDFYKNYLKTTLGVLAPTSGTNALVGPADVQHSTNMDYTDDHSYWNHPNFPASGWSTSNWTIDNTPLFKNTFVEAIGNVMAGLNIANKPYTISEYNHAAPNRYRTEMVHAISAYSAFHGVDGLMFFDYVNEDANWNIDRLDGFFAIATDHSVMGLFPSCAYAYRQGLMTEDTAPLSVDYSSKWIYDQSKTDNKGRWEKYYPYDRRIALTKKIHSNYNKAVQNFSQVNAFLAQSVYTTANNQTSIDLNKGVLLTNTPRFIAISGDLPLSPNTNAGMLTLQNATNFGSITLLASDDKDLNRSQNILLTVSTKMQNTNMIWNGIQTVNNNWGTSPTLNLPQKTLLSLQLYADTLLIYPLDNKGKESAFKKIIGTTTSGGGFKINALKTFDFEIDQSQNPTMWFGLRSISDCSAANINFCDGDSYKLEIEDTTLTNIQWYKNGQTISGAKGVIYIASSIGTYTYTAKNVSLCYVENCCPIVLNPSTNCCKVNICPGVKIVKNR